MKTKLQEKDGMFLIEFPEKTAKEIVEECDKKVGKGKLVYNTDWHENQDFYTKEKSHGGKRWVAKDITAFDKSWNECKEIGEKDGSEMLNLAETLWFLKTYVEHFKEYPDNLKWSWTSSRSSLGSLVNVGSFGSGGVGVDRGYPGSSASFLGVRFSRSEGVCGAKAEQAVADSIESLIEKVKNAGYKVIKEF